MSVGTSRLVGDGYIASWTWVPGTEGTGEAGELRPQSHGQSQPSVDGEGRQRIDVSPTSTPSYALPWAVESQHSQGGIRRKTVPGAGCFHLLARLHNSRVLRPVQVTREDVHYGARRMASGENALLWFCRLHSPGPGGIDVCGCGPAMLPPRVRDPKDLETVRSNVREKVEIQEQDRDWRRACGVRRWMTRQGRGTGQGGRAGVRKSLSR